VPQRWSASRPDTAFRVLQDASSTALRRCTKSCWNAGTRPLSTDPLSLTYLPSSTITPPSRRSTTGRQRTTSDHWPRTRRVGLLDNMASSGQKNGEDSCRSQYGERGKGTSRPPKFRIFLLKRSVMTHFEWCVQWRREGTIEGGHCPEAREHQGPSRNRTLIFFNLIFVSSSSLRSKSE